jgi:hypothetical protein
MFFPVLQFSAVSIIPPLLYTHSFIYHRRGMFFTECLSQYHSNIAPHLSIHLPPTVCNVFLPVLQYSPVSTIPPLLHTHPSIYHPRCIMFFSLYFYFSLTVSFHHCSMLIYSSTINNTRPDIFKISHVWLPRLVANLILDLKYILSNFLKINSKFYNTSPCSNFW